MGATSSPPPPPSQPLAPNTIVTAQNLTSTTLLNGRQGRVRRQQRETDKMATKTKDGRLVERYFVTFTDQAGNDETYLLGRRNLVVVGDPQSKRQPSPEPAQSQANTASGWFSSAFSEISKKVDEKAKQIKENLDADEGPSIFGYKYFWFSPC